jgi:predicted glycosyl hydrolase (DUF1957 family)
MKFMSFEAFNEGFNQVDEINQALVTSMQEYHDASSRLHLLQKKFVDTPKEKINERESLKRALAEANREMLTKQSNFYSILAESGDGDIFNDNTQQ